MKIYSLLTLAILCVACIPSKEQEKNVDGPMNPSAPYMWAGGTFPKSLQISDDYTAAEVTALTEMATAWEASVQNRRDFFDFGARVPELTNNMASLDSLYDGVLGIYKTTQWPIEISGSALAITQIFGRRYNTGTNSEFVGIEHADIMINYDVHMFDTSDTGPGYDLRTVVLHELGHFLGLQHKELNFPRNQSVMYPSIFSYETKREPRATDANDIASRYGISLSAGGAGAAAKSNQAAPKHEASDEGKPVKILIELHRDGNCIHKLDGTVYEHHRVNLK